MLLDGPCHTVMEAGDACVFVLEASRVSECPQGVLDDVFHAVSACRSSGSEDEWPPHHGVCVGLVSRFLLLVCLSVGVLSFLLSLSLS